MSRPLTLFYSHHSIPKLKVAFMLTADGEETTLESSLERELAFCTHHGGNSHLSTTISDLCAISAIHHNAMIRNLGNTMDIDMPDRFGSVFKGRCGFCCLMHGFLHGYVIL